MAPSIPRIGNLTDVAQRYAERGVRVFVVSLSGHGARQLAESLQQPVTSERVMSISDLHARMIAGFRSGIPLFDRPTAVFAGGLDELGAMESAWSDLEAAARRSPCQIDVVRLDTPIIDRSVALRDVPPPPRRSPFRMR